MQKKYLVSQTMVNAKDIHINSFAYSGVKFWNDIPTNIVSKVLT